MRQSRQRSVFTKSNRLFSKQNDRRFHFFPPSLGRLQTVRLIESYKFTASYTERHGSNKLGDNMKCTVSRVQDGESFRVLGST